MILRAAVLVLAAAVAARALRGVQQARSGVDPVIDTTRLIADLEARVAADQGNAEAHYQLGRLLLAAGRGGAEGHLRRATDLAPDSAHYWLALAAQQRTQTLVIARRSVPGLLDRAVEAAQRTGSRYLPDARYQRARERWRRYEQITHRHLMQGEATQVDLVGFMSDWSNVETFFERFARPEPGGEAPALLSQIAEELDLALAAGPGHLDARGLRVVAALEAQEGEAALEAARAAVRAAPDSGRAWALQGLALLRLDRWSEAQSAFDTGLVRMPADECQPYLDLSPVLAPVDSTRVADLTPEARRAFASVYWGLAQPFYLSARNEVRTEYFGRVTYVRARGWEDDRRAVYLRYGPPDIQASLGSGHISEADAVGLLEAQRNTIIWAYSRFQLRFVFTVAPSTDRATFAGNFGLFAQEAARAAPLRFDNVPAVRDVDTALVQLAQFRGDEDRVTLAVFGFAPIGRMAAGAATREAELRAGVVVRDLQLRDVYRSVGTERVAVGDSAQVERRSWRISLLPGEYLLRLEAILAALGRAARSTTPIRVDPIPTDSLQLSTVVVARRVAPRDSTPGRWTDYLIDPSIGQFRPGEPVGLLWEMYNLEPDSQGIARYRVELEVSVKDLERPSVTGRIIGGILDAVGLSARGERAIGLSYESQAPLLARAEKPEHLMVDLGDATPALYGLTLRVTDLVSGQSVSQRRQLAVLPKPQ